MTRKSKFGC